MVQDRNQLFDTQHQQDKRDQRQYNVMQLEKKVQLESWSLQLGQNKTAPKDDNVVANNDADGMVAVGQERLVVDKLKLFRWVSDEFFKYKAENWPQVQAKWPLNGRLG